MKTPPPRARYPRRRPRPGAGRRALPSGTIARQPATSYGHFAGALLGQSALLTALLVYFGWARSRATYNYFGVDLSLIDFSTTEYVLRSVNSVYRPLLALGLGAFFVAALHRRIFESRGRSSRTTRHVRRGLLAGGSALVGLGTLALAWTDFSEQVGAWMPDDSAVGFAWLPTVLAVGFAMLLGADRLARPAKRWGAGILAGLVSLIVLTAFWSVSLFAVHDGHNRAKALVRDLQVLPEAVVLSRDLLAINGHGVTFARLVDDRLSYPRSHYRYRYRYGGLRLLVRTGDRYLLLPVGWRPGRDAVVQVAEDVDVQLQLTAR